MARTAHSAAFDAKAAKKAKTKGVLESRQENLEGTPEKRRPEVKVDIAEQKRRKKLDGIVKYLKIAAAGKTGVYSQCAHYFSLTLMADFTHADIAVCGVVNVGEVS